MLNHPTPPALLAQQIVPPVLEVLVTAQHVRLHPNIILIQPIIPAFSQPTVQLRHMPNRLISHALPVVQLVQPAMEALQTVHRAHQVLLHTF